MKYDAVPSKQKPWSQIHNVLQDKPTMVRKSLVSD